MASLTNPLLVGNVTPAILPNNYTRANTSDNGETQALNRQLCIATISIAAIGCAIHFGILIVSYCRQSSSLRYKYFLFLSLSAADIIHGLGLLYHGVKYIDAPHVKIDHQSILDIESAGVITVDNLIDNWSPLLIFGFLIPATVMLTIAIERFYATVFPYHFSIYWSLGKKVPLLIIGGIHAILTVSIGYSSVARSVPRAPPTNLTSSTSNISSSTNTTPPFSALSTVLPLSTVIPPSTVNLHNYHFAMYWGSIVIIFHLLSVAIIVSGIVLGIKQKSHLAFASDRFSRNLSIAKKTAVVLTVDSFFVVIPLIIHLVALRNSANQITAAATSGDVSHPQPLYVPVHSSPFIRFILVHSFVLTALRTLIDVGIYSSPACESPLYPLHRDSKGHGDSTDPMRCKYTPAAKSSISRQSSINAISMPLLADIGRSGRGVGTTPRAVPRRPSETASQHRQQHQQRPSGASDVVVDSSLYTTGAQLNTADRDSTRSASHSEASMRVAVNPLDAFTTEPLQHNSDRLDDAASSVSSNPFAVVGSAPPNPFLSSSEDVSLCSVKHPSTGSNAGSTSIGSTAVKSLRRRVDDRSDSQNRLLASMDEDNGADERAFNTTDEGKASLVEETERCTTLDVL